MYNEKMKMSFIDSCCGSSASKTNAAITFFKALEPYERSWGADVCTVEKKKVVPVIEDLVGFRWQSYKLRTFILKGYVEWCLVNGVENVCKQLLEIKPNDLGVSKLRRQMVSSPTHLQKYLNLICYPESEGTVDAVYRAFYWLAYGGIPLAEMAMQVKVSDVNLEDKIVVSRGREFQLYESSLCAIKECISAEEFKCPRSNGFEHVKKRCDGDVLLRRFVAPTKNDPYSVMSIRTIMSRKEKKYRSDCCGVLDPESIDLHLSYYRVWISGVFYRTKEAEIIGVPVDFVPLAREISEIKGFPNKPVNEIKNMAREYERDYKRWKEAYSLL